MIQCTAGNEGVAKIKVTKISRPANYMSFQQFSGTISFFQVFVLSTNACDGRKKRRGQGRKVMSSERV